MFYKDLLKNRKKNSEQHTQNFEKDKDNYSISLYGEKVNLYQYIQDNREDTEIIPTIEKYGVNKAMEKLKRYDPEKVSKYYGDFRELSDMRNLMDKSKKAEELWNGLPLELRQKFGNSKHEFFEKGGDWLKSEYQKQIQKMEEQKQTETVNNTTTGETTNE